MINDAPGGKVLPASKDASKPSKDERDLKDGEIDKFSAKFMRAFVVSRAAKKNRKPASSHGARIHGSKSNKGKHRFVFPSKNSTLSTSKPFESIKTKIQPAVPQLTTVSTERKIITLTDTPYENSERILHEGSATKNDKGKYTKIDKHKSRPQNKDIVTEEQKPRGGTTPTPLVPTRHGTTTAIPAATFLVTPRIQPSERLRSELSYDHDKAGSDEDTKDERVTKKGKNCRFSAEEQPRSSPLATNFAGVLAGILILLLIFIVTPRLT